MKESILIPMNQRAFFKHALGSFVRQFIVTNAVTLCESAYCNKRCYAPRDSVCNKIPHCLQRGIKFVTPKSNRIFAHGQKVILFQENAEAHHTGWDSVWRKP